MTSSTIIFLVIIIFVSLFLFWALGSFFSKGKKKSSKPKANKASKEQPKLENVTKVKINKRKIQNKTKEAETKIEPLVIPKKEEPQEKETVSKSDFDENLRRPFRPTPDLNFDDFDDLFDSASREGISKNPTYANKALGTIRPRLDFDRANDSLPHKRPTTPQFSGSREEFEAMLVRKRREQQERLTANSFGETLVIGEALATPRSKRKFSDSRRKWF